MYAIEEENIMGEPEIQMVEAAKEKQNNYSDPLTEFSQAFETLKKNDELIIIPKACQQQEPEQQQHSATNNGVANDQQTQPSVIGKLLPVVLPLQSSILGKGTAVVEPVVHQPVIKQPCLNTEFIGVEGPLIAPKAPNLNVTDMVQPVPISNFGKWLPQVQIVPNPIQPKPVLTPFQMVPIMDSIMQPSLLYQMPGGPSFCIVADNSMNGHMFVDGQQKLEQNQVMLNPHGGVDGKGKRRKRRKQKRMTHPKTRTFTCSYCWNRYKTTNWNFKQHLKMHLRALKCNYCGEAFNTRKDQAAHKCKKAPKEVYHSYPTLIAPRPIRPKPLLTPFQMVPITNLIMQPLLLHQTQSVPSFCNVTNNSMNPMQEIKMEEEEDIIDYDETTEYLEDKSTIKMEYLDEENRGEYLEDIENDPNAVEYLNYMDFVASEYLKTEYLEGEESNENNQENHADLLKNDENENEEEDANEDEDPLGDVNDTVKYLDSAMHT